MIAPLTFRRLVTLWIMLPLLVYPLPWTVTPLHADAGPIPLWIFCGCVGLLHVVFVGLAEAARRLLAHQKGV